MKKFLILLICFFAWPLISFAQNNIYSIDMNIDIKEDGSADIIENWFVKGEDGTEWFKVINGVDGDTLYNYKVIMDGKALQSKDWNIDESLEQKRGYYGINYTNDGLELCFGKYDYKEHNFSVSYTLRDFIVNVSDSQIIYWNLIDKLSDVNFDKFTITVKTFYDMPKTIDVWGYGYKGYAYVKDGLISMSNEENTNMNNSYAVLLAKFPLETFKTDVTSNKYENFAAVKAAADEGSYKQNYDGEKSSFFSELISFFIAAFIFSFCGIMIGKAVKSSKDSYGYAQNKIINKKNTNMFREIPCNKDIYYANDLIYLNNFGYKETNILGAVILKWVKEDKITFINEKKGIFNKDTSSIDMRKKVEFTNPFEKKLFNIMYEASKDGILESKELEKWARKNYDKFFMLFKNQLYDDIDDLKEKGHIRQRVDRKECKDKYVLDEKIYEDSQKLLGLKLFLKEFSKIDTKEVLEVKIWDEYLMFAYLFGIAKDVAKQLNNLYPEVLQEANFDYNTVIFINDFSLNVANAASAARSAAEDYTSGGGGFSFGGGGGGSFGGGGGGSR